MTGLEVALAGAAIKEAASPAKFLIKKFGLPAYERLIVEYSQCFQQHVNTAYDRCKYVKNILYRDNSVELNSQYVHVSFDDEDDVLRDLQISQSIRTSGRVLISGTAGAGKTMFMKWLTLDLIDNIANHQKIPLFLELRYLTKSAISKGLVEWILENTSPAEKRISVERFKIGLELGQFIIVLDAVDEIKPELREDVLDQVRTLIRNYPACSVLLSSRPDDELESIQELRVYRTKKMEQFQIIEVIEKLDFDEEVKKRLIDKLKKGLFFSHSEFLSNPLLATIMLLNFDHSADIPTKLTSFYRQAFEALYQRHDAAKGAYRRGHYAGLPLDEYEKVFSAFCFDSYLDSKVEFSDSELLDYFRAAATYCNINLNPELLVQDAMKSVCVIQREGLDNVFAHRTFQEYFTALFLSRYREEDFVDQVKDAVLGWRNNNVLKMLIEIAPEPVEQDWLHPELKKIIAGIKNADASTVPGATKIFKAFYASIEIATDTGKIRGFGHTGGGIGTRLSTIGDAYNPPFELSRSIFQAKPIFSDFDTFLLTLDPTVADRFRKRVEVFDDEDHETILEVEAHDIQWLMNTGMPIALASARDDVVRFYNGMTDRIKNRSTAIARLKARRHNINPIRKRPMP
jgi:hypothetical protein